MNESGVVFTISGKQVLAERPTPVLPGIEAAIYNRHIDPHEAVKVLVDGHLVLINDFYSSGLEVLNALKKYVNTKRRDQSFIGQAANRSLFRELSHRLLLFISNHKLMVKKAPEIGWLKKLYPDLKEFLLPFPQVQGLNSSWQWYKNGLSVPGLSEKIHPWFGTYFPTRFEHLKPFDKWLKQYKGEKKSAIDIGIGSGVLSFLMLKHGFEKVLGTDSNPNAIIGLHEAMMTKNQPEKIELFYGDLFANCDAQSEIIVFNPPWLPAPHHIEGIDKAIFYDEDLFPRFFAEAKKHLKPEGRVVLLFSNLAQTTKVTAAHPIETELAFGGRFEKELFIQIKVAPASEKTRRNQNWRSEELVEFWVLRGVTD